MPAYRSRGRRVPRTWCTMIIFLVVSVVLWGALHVLLRSQPLEGTVMISHRGMAGSAPENTLAAIDEAIRRGAQFVEIDIRRSADGVIVLMHDQAVDRTTNGQGRVGELAWDEISTLDAGSHFSPTFAGEPVPTLDDVLTLLQTSSITLVLEVKQPDRYPGIALQVAEKLQQFDLGTRVVVVSFDHDWLDKFGSLMPDVPVGYLQVGACIRRQMPGDSLVDVHWISVLVDPTLIWRMHRRGHRVWAWTVNDVRLARLLTWLGVDGITTDHPDMCQDGQGAGDAGPVQ
jgi:glycerophosphoryl diester phosphodiesterase